MSRSELRLLVVDDDEAVRRSLGALLLSRGHMVQAFDSGEALLASNDLQRGGCVILDLRLGGISGLQVFQELRARGSPLVVLFLSGHGDIPIAVEAVQNGAFSWLEKPCTDERLLEQVNLALQRAATLEQQRRARAAALALWRTLTQREQEVQRLVALGKTSREVARALVPEIDHRTVETHRASAFAKLGISSHELPRFIAENEL